MIFIFEKYGLSTDEKWMESTNIKNSLIEFTNTFDNENQHDAFEFL
jgi:hypothetical protein